MRGTRESNAPPRQRTPLGASCWLFILLLAVAAPSQAQESYGFYRIVDGPADLVQGGSDTRNELEANFPVLTGDRIEVSRSARVEAVLADGAYLRVDGDTELAFDRLAFSGDAEGDRTVLRLLYGEVQVVLRDEAAGPDAFRVDTRNASIYLPRQGSYRITTNGSTWTELVVRDGYAEVGTDSGSAIVRAGEASWIEGESWARPTIEAAPARDSLERWGDDLLREASYDELDDVEPELRYAAAPLARHGSWIDVDGRRAWRPRVAASWRPYHRGWWTSTPAGLTWVSHEPYGWITHHYGRWSYAGHHGWVWYPGYTYSPASVYWYWGPSHVAWIPIGYYSDFYSPFYYASHGLGFGLRLGILGWAGGYGSYYADWSFCDVGYFGYRDSYRHYRTGAQLTRAGYLDSVPRGVIATDSRGVTPDQLRRPTDLIRDIADAAGRTPRGSGRMADLTEFVGRRQALPSSVARAVTADDGERSIGRIGRRPGEWTAAGPARGTRGIRPGGDRTGGSRFDRTPTADRPLARRPTDGIRDSRGRARRPIAVGDSVRETLGSRGQRPARSWRERDRAPGNARRFVPRDRSRVRGETPTVRRVLEGVRSYRERERTGRGTATRPSTGREPTRTSPGRTSGSYRDRSPGRTSGGSYSRPSGSSRRPSASSGSRSSGSRSSASSGSRSSGSRSSASRGSRSSGSRSSGSVRSGSSRGSRSSGSARSGGSRSSGSRSSGSGRRSGGGSRRGGGG